MLSRWHANILPVGTRISVILLANLRHFMPNLDDCVHFMIMKLKSHHFDLRYRGFVQDGFDDSTPEKFNSIRGTRFWQVVAARLAFVIVFEVRILTVKFY